jgi:xanthine dehydrogenase YagR molybdenum-binding subunit
MNVTTRVIGAPVDRLDGPEKVKGTARYAFEQPVDRPAYLHPLQATIVTGRITGIDGGAATAEPGVLALLTHENAPKLASSDGVDLEILQSEEVAFRGQFVGGVIAETPEIARHAASLVRLQYEERAHDVVLRPDRPDLFAPQRVQDGSETDTARGDVDAALASAAVTLDATYTTAMYHNNPMEPHATIAIWTGDGLTLYCASQGVHQTRAQVAPLFGLDPERIRIISPYVGGGFGSKVYPHADVILAVMAAQLVASRPVKLALTRQQMFSQVGYRTPTIQRIRLAADAGRLTAIAHDVVEQTSKIKVVGLLPGAECRHFVESTAVPTRTMYAAPNRRTTHRVAALDVPPPTIMRGPGETPGMFALESAMDEMAIACGLDSVEFRIRNEPEVDPESSLPYSSRELVACLREGAGRFGWERRDPTPRARRDRGWLVGSGVAASTFPIVRLPGSAATIRTGPDRRYVVSIGAADIGTGAWTALTQIAADALGVALADVELQIGDTALPMASTAGGSSGITSWGSAIVEAARKLRARLEADRPGTMPPHGLEVTTEMPDNPYAEQFSMHAFGAQFAEVRVREDTGEVRVPRMVGVFDAGRIINSKTARSQLLGGMTMGLSMALHEDSFLDVRFGHVANQDFAEYHIATNADAEAIEVYWLDEEDLYANPMGSKGLGEIGMVGTAAAIANAVHHATGIRVRDLPITLDKLVQ